MRKLGVLALACWLFTSVHVAASDGGREGPTAGRLATELLERMPATGTRRAIETDAPRLGDGPLRVRDVASGVALRASLVDATSSPGARVGDTVHYADPVSRESHRVVRREPRGLEDVIELRQAPPREALVYRVAVTAAGVRVVGRTLEFLDGGGVPRLRMAPPFLVDAAGRRIEVDVTVARCAHDTDPRSPIGRAVTAPLRDCEVTLDWSGRDARYPLVIDPSWTATDSLAVARREMAIGYLAGPDQVVVAGGIGVGDFSVVNAIASVEIYDVASETFSAGMPLASERARPSFAVLDETRFLVVGGARSGGGGSPTVVAGTEIYDGTTATWSAVVGPATARVWSEAVRLDDGSVLLAGGKTDHYFSTSTSAAAERFEPATNSWGPAGTMTAPRYGNFILLPLPGGRALMAGGFDALTTPSTTSIYDASTNTWTAGAPMAAGRGTGIGAVLPSGDVLVAGGDRYVGGALVNTDTTEIYRPATDEWESAGAIGAPVDYRTNGAVVRSDGIVVAPAGIGARGLYSETFDPVTEVWSTGCDPTRTSLVALGAVVLPDERVLVVGGQDGTGIRAEAWLSGPDPAACDDGNPCTDDACDPVDGCTSMPNTASCDDGDACTTGDVCAERTCSGTMTPGCGIDAGAPDSGAPDAGDPDAGERDAGTIDGGAGDAGVGDAGVPDTGFDAAAPDAGAIVGSTGGCGCRVAPHDASGSGWLALALALALVRRRR